MRNNIWESSYPVHLSFSLCFSPSLSPSLTATSPSAGHIFSIKVINIFTSHCFISLALSANFSEFFFVIFAWLALVVVVFLLAARRLTNYALIKRLLLLRPFFKESLAHLRRTTWRTQKRTLPRCSVDFGFFFRLLLLLLFWGQLSLGLCWSAPEWGRGERRLATRFAVRRQKLMCIINLLLHFGSTSFCLLLFCLLFYSISFSFVSFAHKSNWSELSLTLFKCPSTSRGGGAREGRQLSWQVAAREARKAAAVGSQLQIHHTHCVTFLIGCEIKFHSTHTWR